MDKEEKRRLKKLGKELVKKRSRELMRKINSSNPAKFGSDEYIQNEIDIRKVEREVRKNPGVFAGELIRAEFMVIPQEYNFEQGYPGTTENYWECRSCGYFLSSLPAHPVKCKCGNVKILDHGFLIQDESALLLVKLIAKF